MSEVRVQGVEARLGDLVFSVSSALDLVAPAVAEHHRRVARIARALARELGVSADDTKDLLLAAALHDSGAFSLRERLDLMRYEVRQPGQHAAAGYRLLMTFPLFEKAASIVRYHHLPWAYGHGEHSRGRPVPPASHLLHLADRASVLPPADCARVAASGSGALYNPVHVGALQSALARPDFWHEVAAGGDGDLRDDPVLATVVLGEEDFAALARFFRQLVDFRSNFTATHTSGVVAVTRLLAPLAGVVGWHARKLEIAAGLHDLGKLAVPREMLEKETPLTRAEFAAVRSHPLQGWRILERIKGMGEINAWANYHHERLDGRGYPFGLPAGELPLESRVVAVADVFTALTEERPYRRGMSGREAAGIMVSMAAGGALDPDLVDTLARNRREAAVLREAAQDTAFGRYRAVSGADFDNALPSATAA